MSARAEAAATGSVPAGLRKAVALSLGLHAAIAGAMFIDMGRRPDPPAALPPAAAIEIMPLPAAPAAPPRETPPEPEQPIARHDPQPPMPALPLVASATDAQPAPEKPAPQTPTPPPSPPPSPPSPPSVPERAIAAAPTQGQPQPGPSKAQQRWDGQLLARLERRKRYPAAAQNAGQEDVVYVRISVDRSGNLLNSAIARSRHFDLLDQAVLDLVKRVTPLPPLPSDIAGDTYTVTVPIDFFVAGRRN